MNHRTFRRTRGLVVIFLLLALGTQCASAANVPISGSYEVLEKTNAGSHTKILLRLHLTNHGQGLLYLQKILLWDFAHPPSASPRASSIALHAGVSEETTQEFVIPRLQFDQWQRGLRPRVVLGLQTATGTKITQAIRLDRVAGKRGE
ncbi:MAG: hypothetical protein WCA49_00890 [Candidatus Sulfotelmatobacter sp.]